MPTKKITKEQLRKETPKVGAEQKNPRLSLKSISLTLSVIFFTVWIIIGVFLLVVIVQSLRQGAFAGLFGAPQTPATGGVSQPAQTVIPGVGLVDVECVKQALPAESIQKIADQGDTSALTAEENSKLEPCILQEEAASPSPSSAQ